jgi:hypothetical protein
MSTNENDAIQQVIEQAYIKGIHENQDEELVRSGFHPDFSMLVFKDNDIEKVSIDGWLSRLKQLIADNPSLWSAETKYKIELIDVSYNAATVKIDVYKGDTHFSKDYMLLYKFKESWKIVSKIYAIPD